MKLIIGRSDTRWSEKLIALTAGLGFYAKQFYFGASGSLQIGDIILMISVVLALLVYGLRLEKRDLPFLMFILASMIINGIYYISSSDIRFNLSVLFMLYNGIAVLLLFRPSISCDYFLSTIRSSCKLVLITQLLLLATGIGKWAYLGTRYIGTFNDPNQYGFYVLSCFFCIYVISVIRRERMNIIWIFLVAAEILPSASTGMIAMYLIFNVGFVVGLNTVENKQVNKKQTLAVVLFSVFVIIVVIFYKQILTFLGELNIFGVGRIVQRLTASSTVGGLGLDFLEDRGLMRTIELPHYFIYGSGEGGWLRFKSIFNEGYEIHSTVIGLAYYYGIIPYCLLVRWVYSNVKKLVTSVIFVYIALFLEALTLINHRQPIFWFLIVLASHSALKRVSGFSTNKKNTYN